MKAPFTGRITTQLLIVALAPAMLMFIVVCSLMYAQRLAEVRLDLSSKGQLLAAALGESSQYAVVSGNASTLNLTLQRLVRSDPGVAAIRVLGSQRESLVEVRSSAPGGQAVMFEHAIYGQVLNFDVFSSALPQSALGPPRPEMESQEGPVVGYVQVDMSPEPIIAAKRSAILEIALQALVAAAFSCILGVLLTRRLRNQMYVVMRALHRIQIGKYEVYLPKDAPGDIGRLQATICDIAQALKETTQNLESKVERRTIELEEALAKIRFADNEKRELIARANRQLDDERKRIAAEIHDDFNAVLIAIKMRAQQIEHWSAQGGPYSEELRKAAAAILSATDDAYASARRLVKRLHPEILETLGLAAALEDMVRNYNELFPTCRYELRAADEMPVIHGVAAITTFRLVQESLANASQHAGASQVVVTLELADGGQDIAIVVNDNGHGMQPTISVSGTGLGLAAMRERVEAVGGKMQLTSSLTEGTTLSFVLPLSSRRLPR
ncbi:sensor histidine kinase [Rhodoferax sp.]|uniref:sensor histidine kinase n=1 Tax=Rhodoferax sp. TaxID=50421 RepID=UPI0027756E97|nr:histidine kinase [Rhodoferax sp.]